MFENTQIFAPLILPPVGSELKAFHCEIINDHAALKQEQNDYKEIPIIRKLDNGVVQRNYLQVKQDV